MNCQYCDERMTSASSHWDHNRECHLNPINRVVILEAELREARMLLRAALQKLVIYNRTQTWVKRAKRIVNRTWDLKGRVINGTWVKP